VHRLSLILAKTLDFTYVLPGNQNNLHTFEMLCQMKKNLINRKQLLTAICENNWIDQKTTCTQTCQLCIPPTITFFGVR